MSSTLTSKTPSLSASKTKSFNVGMIVPITKKGNSDFFLRAAEAMCELGFSVLALAEGDNEAQKVCFELAQRYPKNFKILESLAKNRAHILETSDVLVFPVSPTEKILKEVVKEGIVPILPKGSKFKDFDPEKESGNSFTFSQSNFWEFLAAIIRASENFKFSYDWENLRKNLKETLL